MKHTLIIMTLLLGVFFVGGMLTERHTTDSIYVLRGAYVKGFDAGIEACNVSYKEGYEFVDLSIGCECGNRLVVEHPMDDEAWPLTYFCARCKMRYTMTKENRPPEINEWYREYGYADEVAE